MSSSTSCVGIIGVGAMGFAMLEQLVAASFKVSVFDPSPAARERATAAGATSLDNANAVFALGIPVITCLVSPKALESTIEEAIAAAECVPQVGSVIEASTLDLAVKGTARARLAERGIVLLDCPVSGTSAQARQGDLVVFASGDKDALARCQPIFDAIGRETVHAGEFGSGMRLKLLANHLVGLHSAAGAEVLMLARRSGLDPQLVLKVLTTSAANSRILEVRGPLMIDHQYLPATGSIDIIVKDGFMIRAMGEQAGCALPMFERAHDLFRLAQADGLGAHDIAALHQYLLEDSHRL